VEYTDRHKNKYVFDIGTNLVYAIGITPRPNQTYPGFGDAGTVIGISSERHDMSPNTPCVIVKFDRCGVHTEAITCFWPPGSKVSQIGQALAQLAGYPDNERS